MGKVKAIIFDCFGVLYAPTSGVIFHKYARDQELLDYVQELRNQYKIGVLSNMSLSGMQQIFSLDEQKQFFDDVLVSGQIGMTKPNPNIYSLACERLGVTPQEAIMIDDSAHNCEGAQAVGMQAIMYRDLASLRTELNRLTF